MLLPFMSQIEVRPVTALYQTRSWLPLPSKSPTCVGRQAGSVTRVALPMICVPLISHTDDWPVVSLRHTMSDLPSPLKSPSRTGRHAALFITVTPLENVVPFMSQIAVWPVVSLRQIRSERPLPSKSPASAGSSVSASITVNAYWNGEGSPKSGSVAGQRDAVGHVAVRSRVAHAGGLEHQRLVAVAGGERFLGDREIARGARSP